MGVFVPLIVMGILAVTDFTVGPAYGFLPLLSLGPALAAVLLSPVGTALIGALAMLVSVPLARFDGLLGQPRATVALATIAGVTGAGAVASAVRQRRERELAGARAVAELVERILLRPVPSRVGNLRAAVRYASATSSAQVGGDLYEVLSSDGVLRLIVGDVAGHGLASVTTAAVVLGAFRESAPDASGLPEIAARIEASLERTEAVEEFVTAVLAEIRDGDQVEILNCGHPPPLLMGGQGAARFVEPAESGLPLGLAALRQSSRRPLRLALSPGQRVLFYTDGITEARDKGGQFYPIEERLHLLDEPDLDTALAQLHADVIRHVGLGLSDDATTLLVERILEDQALPDVSPRRSVPAASQQPLRSAES